MSLQPLSNAFSEEKKSNPYFNVDAAIEVTKWYLEQDRDVANMVLSDVISKRVRDIAEETGPEIEAIISKSIEEKFELLKTTIANGIINKSMSDDTVDATVEAVDIVKAFNFTEQQRRQNARGRARDAYGRFAPEGHTVLNPIAARHGQSNKDVNREQYHNAVNEADYAIADLRSRNVGTSGNGLLANIHYIDSRGNHRMERRSGRNTQDFVGRNKKEFFGGNEGPEHERITSIDWFDGNADDGYESIYNLLNSDTLPSIDRAGDIRVGESGATRNMRQLGAMSQALDEMGVGTIGGPKTQAALTAGKMVGEFGPEAEKYAGPSIRRLGYRYRGTERTPDEKMLRAIKESSKRGDQRNSLFMLGSNKEYSMEDTTAGVERVPVPNKFFQYFQGQLANPKLIDLQTNSGAIAPSEGVIISRDGKVVTQAVGYGDDHYLPFNMRKLSKVKGGDYVRTRTLGGPTTEDIYAGMITGARSMSVVSHSGIFTLEFDPAFRGGRRLNDKAARMMKRYGQLVDSLASEKVRPDDIPSDRIEELKDQVIMEIPGSTPEIMRMREDKFEELRDAERANPQPSREMREAWDKDFGRTIAENYDSGDGEPMSWEHLKAQAGLQSGQPVDTDREAISVLGLDDKYNKFVQSKERAYRRENSPLRLNGEGYRDALMALKEQFPYYIKEVNWIPPNRESAAKGRKDVGYVKPKHLRSANIKEGYWDPTIEGYMNSQGYGKRNADRENYSNARAYDRLDRTASGFTEQVRNKKGKITTPAKTIPWKQVQRERRRQSFSQGGGSQANSSTTSTATITRASTGAVNASSFGPVYSGFTQSRHLTDNKDVTDYDVLQQAIKIRHSLRDMGRIAYVDPATQEQKAFEPFGPTGNDAQKKLNLLLGIDSDIDFEDAVITGKIPVGNLRTTIKNLSGKSGSNTGQVSALATELSRKGLLKDLTPPNPTSAVSLATDLSNGMKKNYDFTRGGLDGMHYLPGLAKREYKAAWVTDTDISSFAASSERRFGYDMGLNTHQSTFDKMSVNMGKAAKEALTVAQDWTRQNRQYGGPANVPGTHTVKYGGKVYSNYGVNDLQTDIANDVLAVAKMTQLKRLYGSSDENPDKAIQDGEKVISLDEVLDDSTQAEFNADKDPNDKPVGDLKTGSKAKSSAPRAVQIAGDHKKLEEARSAIHSMVGLGNIKTEFDDLIKESRINQYRQSKGLKTRPTTKHLIFSGDPGTGKTTVAEQLGKAYNAMGLIPSDQVMVITRADLVSPYQGQTAKKVKDTFTKGKGGVIFIDEAYSLVNGSDDSYGYEAVDELVNQVERNREDTVVILAGYPKEMSGLMNANPGLKSRFPRTMHFPNYSGEEMSEIGRRSLKTSDYRVSPFEEQYKRAKWNVSGDLNKDAQDRFDSVMRKIASLKNNANGRDVRNFNDEIIRQHTRRISKIPREDLDPVVMSVITTEDINNAEKAFFKSNSWKISLDEPKVSKRLKGL